MAVIEAGSFQKAATQLHITQSAISQRIAAFEEEIGAPLVARTNPVVATPTGRRLVEHGRTLLSLEREVLSELHEDVEQRGSRVAIAVNADSVATWFMSAMHRFIVRQNATQQQVFIDLRIDNEERTYEMVRRGEAFACVSAADVRLAGCDRVALRDIRYIGVATRGFIRKHFPRGLTYEAVSRAPTVLFEPSDQIHGRFLKLALGRDPPDYPRHYVPTSQGFVEMIVRGLVYGVVDQIQVPKHLGSRRLTRICPSVEISVPLYWYYPRRESPTQRRLREALIAATHKRGRGDVT